jgi:co-chaperonin GroES (HSP10)
MPIKALGEYILIKPEIVEVTSASGILISTEDEGEVKNIGEVISIGDGVLGIMEGDRVYFNPQAGNDIEIEGVKLRALRPQDIIAKVIA